MMKKSLRKMLVSVLGVILFICAFSFVACTDKKGEQVTDFRLITTQLTLEMGTKGNVVVEHDGSEKLTYYSENADIATVDDVGCVSTLKSGVAFIKVSLENKHEYCKVIVTESDETVVLEKTNAIAVKGSDFVLNALVFVDGVELNKTVDWNVVADSDDYFLAESNNRVTFRPNEVGTYTIVAATEKTTAQCIIKVVSDTAKRLDYPDVSVDDCTKISWNKVEGACGYNVLVGGITDWIFTDSLSMDISTYCTGENEIEYGHKANVYVVALSGENYEKIDSYAKTISISHKYETSAQGTPSCSTACTMYYSCIDCGHAYSNENYYAEHDFENLVCKQCGVEKTNGVLYGYDGNYLRMPTPAEANDPQSEWSIKYAPYYNNYLKNYAITNELVAEDAEITQDVLDAARKEIVKINRATMYLYNALYNNRDQIPASEREECYYVITYIGDNQDDVWIKETYDDGEHGVLPVRYIQNAAFSRISNVKRVICPESIIELRGLVFSASTIETIILPGVTYLPLIDTGNYQANNFNYCYNLKQLVVGDGFTSDGRNFFAQNMPNDYQSMCDIFVIGDGSKKVSYLHNYPNASPILTGITKYCYQPQNYNEYVCGLWFFDEEYNVVYKEHEYEFSTCIHCGAENTYGVVYSYDSSNDTYYVSNGKNVKKSNIKILEKYNDGVHGELPVTRIGDNAFYKNANIIEVVLPDTVTAIGANAFNYCSNLKLFDMRGVTIIQRMDAAEALNNCGSLEKVIINKDLQLEAVQRFSREYGEDGKPADIYIYGNAENSTFKLSYAVKGEDSTSNNRNLSGNRYYYDESGKCGFWSFDNNIPVFNDHASLTVEGICPICDQNVDTFGLKYSYEKDIGYVFDGCTDKGLKVIKPFATFNDGVNGRHNVVAVKITAFRYNTVIEMVILPDTIKTIRNSAFEGCTSLKYVQARGVVSFDLGRFANCDRIETLIVGHRTFIASSFYSSNLTAGNLVIYYDQTYINDTNNSHLRVEKGSSGYTSNLFSGKVYKYSATEADGCFYYDENGIATPYNVNSYFEYVGDNSLSLVAAN